jgi:hypothetical protein
MQCKHRRLLQTLQCKIGASVVAFTRHDSTKNNRHRRWWTVRWNSCAQLSIGQPNFQQKNKTAGLKQESSMNTCTRWKCNLGNLKAMKRRWNENDSEMVSKINENKKKRTDCRSWHSRCLPLCSDNRSCSLSEDLCSEDITQRYHTYKQITDCCSHNMKLYELTTWYLASASWSYNKGTLSVRRIDVNF